MSQARMLAGFALYAESVTAAQPHAVPVRATASTQIATTALDHNTIATPVGCRLHRIIRLPRGWRLWLATRDFIYGTHLELHDTGRVVNITTRDDEGDDVFQARPSDEEIRSMR